MATDFILPSLGENIAAADVLNVLVKVGDTIKVDQNVLELETDKATLDVPSTVAGVVKEVRVKAGDKIKIGAVVLVVDAAAGAAAAAPAAPAKATKAAAEAPAPAKSKVADAPAKAAAPAAKAAAPAAAGGRVGVVLPSLGEGIKAADVLKVLVAVGDAVTVGQGLLELETDKATLEVPSDAAGVVKEINVKQGDKAKVGEVIMVIESAAGAPAAASPAPAAPAAEAATASAPATAATPAAPVAVTAGKPSVAAGAAILPVPASPSVRRFAREIGLEIADVPATGDKGRITLDDVKAQQKKVNAAFKAGGSSAAGAAAGSVAPARALPDFTKWGEVKVEPMNGIRKATAAHMQYCWSNIPHVTQFDKTDITDLEVSRAKFAKLAEKAGTKLTPTAIIMKVVAEALKRFPNFNASIDMVNQTVIQKSYINIGCAVDTDRGLLVPVIRDVDKKGVIEIARELGEVAKKARDRKTTLEDMQGGTFTVSNLGGIGGTNFTPIVNWPEVAILGVARGGMEPVWDGNAFVPRNMMPLSLSYDHRVIDGADGARFLRFICEALENPFLLSL